MGYFRMAYNSVSLLCKFLIMRVLLVLCVLLIPFSAKSQEWLALYQKAQTSYNSSQFETAYQEATETLKKYQAESGETND